MTIHRLGTTIVTIALTATVIACSGSETTGPESAASVEVSPSSQTFASLGDTSRFTAVAKDANGNTMTGKSFTWSSGNPLVAAVDASSGLVTAVGNGPAEIRAVTDGVQGTAEVVVSQVPFALSVVPDSATLTVWGDTVTLSATVVDSNGASISEPDLSWESSDTSVVRVANDGLATAVGNGSTTITVDAVLLSDTVTVTVQFVAWTFSTGAWAYITSSPAVGADGTVYIGSWDGNVHALNPDGNTKWSFAAGDVVMSSPAIGADGTIYVGSLDNRVYAINPDGTLKWSFVTGDGVYDSSPAIGPDGTVYVGSADGNVYAITADGTLRWSFATGNDVFSSPAIGADGTVYVGSVDHNIYAITPDGKTRWSFATGSLVYNSSPAIGTDGTVYVGSEDGKVYALNPHGTLKWSFETGRFVLSSPAIGVDGAVYVGSTDSSLYAINPDGTLKWSFATGDGVYSSPAIGADGTVYVGSYDSNVYAITPDGVLKWSVATGGIVNSSPAIGANGIVYIGSNDGKLYALRSTSPGLGVTPWPKFRHDNRNTGNVATAEP